jgi:hypothetical protein
MRKYTTISVPVEVKKHLEMFKGRKTWGEFLLEMQIERQPLKGKEAFEELRQLLSKEDLKNIRESSREFRKNFALR